MNTDPSYLFHVGIEVRVNSQISSPKHISDADVCDVRLIQICETFCQTAAIARVHLICVPDLNEIANSLFAITLTFCKCWA